jgi:hypothetical protein
MTHPNYHFFQSELHRNNELALSTLLKIEYLRDLLESNTTQKVASFFASVLDDVTKNIDLQTSISEYLHSLALTSRNYSFFESNLTHNLGLAHSTLLRAGYFKVLLEYNTTPDAIKLFNPVLDEISKNANEQKVISKNLESLIKISKELESSGSVFY